MDNRDGVVSVQIVRHEVSVGASLSLYAEDAVRDLCATYGIAPVESVVTFSKPFYASVCEISLKIGKKAYIKAHAEGEALYFAFDSAFHKLRKNLSKYKKRIIAHGKKSERQSGKIDAVTKVIPISADAFEDADTPPIVAEMVESFSEMTVSEAIATMELEGGSALIFRNKSTGAVNVLHKRGDGTIGWVDPTLTVQSA
ncbi:HPF/RaiA family ribosome-associated protein [Candidatus Hydrogenosomobacter endosymbioticus]|uniref:Ribosome hibernation promoting factor n=1 Tax=Candidatus Hydrogenosomobacter endosymbioticus TaxID=2558174 RepID=A0ABM7V9D9_9PROT|nr:HPF/RaiA family ribosome-associated protein [Candidatus Hydrogenosomobacter endosymbioticus]BDB96113.1 ribosomal subunit interface protein [Candidatus Hydrogenosomobacter endosymbioticus]